MKTDKEIFSFVQATLNLFKAVPNLKNEKFSNYTLNNARNLANGFFITERAFQVCPCVAGQKIFNFLKNNFGYDIFELNQSFYKSFATVTELSPQQILVNKLLHYFSTYGMEELGIFERQLVYIPNDALELPKDSKPLKITVIDALDNAEIANRAVNMIQSGAALSQETVKNLIEIVKFLGINLDVDEIKNKEFAMKLYERLNILPKNPVQFLRYMIYIASGSTLLIKSKETVTALKISPADLDEYFSRYIAENGAEKLASIFHRFKPLWLAFKQHSKYLRTTINKIRKLADKYHKPAPPKLLERLTSARNVDIDELKTELSKITTYKKISLANSILYRLAAPQNIIYQIRNGKNFVDKYLGGINFDAQEILNVILDSIVADIAPNVSGKKIFIPANFNYAAPVSEKNFVGNIPCGSSYTFAEKSVVVGVHWFNVVKNENEWRVDLDLHLNSKSLDIGWQNDFTAENFFNTKEEKIIFSGDMTDAPISKGGATEAYFIGETFTDDLISVNLNYYNFNENISVPFQMILADVNQEKINRKYLLDAREIAFCVPNEISSGQMLIGYLAANENGEKIFYFHSGKMGNSRVARSDELTAQAISAMNTTLKSCLSLKEILERGGAILENVDAENCDINLNPAEVTKDILLNLFAK